MKKHPTAGADVQTRDEARVAILESFERYQREAEAASQRASQKLFAERYSAGELPDLAAARHVIPTVDHKLLSYWLKQRAQGWDGHARYRGRAGTGILDIRPDIRDAIDHLTARHPFMTGRELHQALVAQFGDSTPSISTVRRYRPVPSVADPAVHASGRNR